MHIEYNITIFILLKRGGFYIILCVLSIIDESENKNKDISTNRKLNIYVPI